MAVAVQQMHPVAHLPLVLGVLRRLEVATVIIAEAALSFLGVGIQPPTPTWGSMLADGKQYLRNAWWVSTLPGLTIMLTVLSVNLLGDWLRDALNPRLQFWK